MTRLPVQLASRPLTEGLLGRCLVLVHEQGQPAVPTSCTQAVLDVHGFLGATQGCSLT